jgi:hypothetical protein
MYKLSRTVRVLLAVRRGLRVLEAEMCQAHGAGLAGEVARYRRLRGRLAARALRLRG